VTSAPINPADSEPCEFLPWDTEFFGQRIARAKGETLTSKRVAEIDAWCGRQKIACLYFHASADDPPTTRLAEANGFQLVDVRLTFDRSLKGLAPDALNNSQIDLATPVDLKELQKLARISHTNTRFYFDGRFSRSRCDDLYERWITVAMEAQAQAVFVARERGSMIGYVTCHGDPTESHIGLIAVSESAAGQGWGSKLVQRALAWAAEHRHLVMSVATQGRNIAAQRLYQKHGFRTRSLYLAYHRWYVPAAD
jgi:dTDP-4-amino-4,6-dideoxy-D-galactose acyltransferase